MSETIIIQLIIGFFTILGTVITCYSNSKKTQWRIEQLEKKVEKHNSVIERVYRLEQRVEDLNYE